MVEIEMGFYLNTETTNDGDIAEIVGEAVYNEKEINGQKKRLLDIPVKVGAKDLTYSPPFKTQKIFAENWGTNTAEWLGKRFVVVHKEIEIGGKDKLVVRAVPKVENE